MMTPSDPFSSSEEHAAARFDDALRHQLGDVQATPPPGAWDTLRAQLPAPKPAPAPSAWRSRLASFGGGVLVGALLWWGGGRGVPDESTTLVTAGGEPVRIAEAPLKTTGAPLKMTGAPVKTTDAPVKTTDAPLEKTGAPLKTTGAPLETTGAPVEITGAPTLPATAAPTTVEDRDSLIQQEARAHLAPLTQPTDSARLGRLRELVADQTRALAALAKRLDSVKQFLPETRPALAVPANPARHAADSLLLSHPSFPPPSRWSALLLTETTPSWAVLPTRSPQTPNREQSVAVLSQQVLGQWQASLRWAVRAGVGTTMLTTQARTVAEKVQELLTVDSTVTVSASASGNTTNTITVLIVRDDSVMRIEPIVNGSGQIIDFDTVWIPRPDTVRSVTTTISRDTTRTTVVTYRQQTLRERHQQQFRPTYRFWTLPLSTRYTVYTGARWTLGAVLGGQLQFLRDSRRPVWNGDEYVLRRVRASETPYRAVSLSVSAGLEAQYRLSPRLSAVLAPTVRWWALSAERGGGGPARLLPAAQVGVSWGL